MHCKVTCKSVSYQFQSTPPVAGGRCPSDRSAACACSGCFNPRPPLPGGDAGGQWADVKGPDGFNPRPPLPGGDATKLPLEPLYQWPVSIHAPRCRGAMQYPLDELNERIPVSIHAPRCRGAMLKRGRVRSMSSMFQSTPPVAGGRCILPGSVSCCLRRTRFNPRPPLPGGDARCGRAMPTGPDSFNPRPPLPGGDAPLVSCPRGQILVSIHAPRCRGAMPAAKLNPMKNGLFQSTPPVAGGRCLFIRRAQTTLAVFQSTPPVAGGRCPVICRSQSPAKWFQSTPPVAGGRCARRSRPRAIDSGFQSTPPVAGGRCATDIRGFRRHRCFNPRPPLPGGDAISSLYERCAELVSIHAPRCRGAMRWQALRGLRKVWMFQSTPPVAGGRCIRSRRSSTRS